MGRPLAVLLNKSLLLQEGSGSRVHGRSLSSVVQQLWCRQACWIVSLARRVPLIRYGVQDEVPGVERISGCSQSGHDCECVPELAHLGWEGNARNSLLAPACLVYIWGLQAALRGYDQTQLSWLFACRLLSGMMIMSSILRWMTTRPGDYTAAVVAPRSQSSLAEEENGRRRSAAVWLDTSIETELPASRTAQRLRRRSRTCMTFEQKPFGISVQPAVLLSICSAISGCAEQLCSIDNGSSLRSALCAVRLLQTALMFT